MKKFNFPLQKILDYKEYIQKNEEDVLKQLRSSYVKLCSNRDELLRIRREYAETFEGKCGSGIQISEAVIYKSYISQLNEQIEEFERRIAMVEKEIERQIERVLVATMERTSLDKLKDKCLEEYSFEERKEEERFINEFVSNASASQADSGD
jgi:flagellar FliJ protein